MFVDRPLQDFWKFRRIAIIFGKFDEENDDENNDQIRYVTFDGSESKNPMDWIKIEVRAHSSDRNWSQGPRGIVKLAYIIITIQPGF